MKLVNPPNALWSLLVSRHWGAAVTMLEGSLEIRGNAATRYSLSQSNSVSIFPLHFALLESGSEDIVLALLNAFKPAAKHHYNHDLPLHLAIKQARSLKIITALHDAYPDSFKQTCNGMKLLNLCSKCYPARSTTYSVVKRFIRAKLEPHSKCDEAVSLGLAQTTTKDAKVTQATLKEIKDTQDQILGKLHKLGSSHDAILQTQAVVLSKLSEVTRYIEEGKVDREEDKLSMEVGLKKLRNEVEADIASLERKIKELQTEEADTNLVIPEVATSSHHAESFVQIGSAL